MYEIHLSPGELATLHRTAQFAQPLIELIRQKLKVETIDRGMHTDASEEWQAIAEEIPKFVDFLLSKRGKDTCKSVFFEGEEAERLMSTVRTCLLVPLMSVVCRKNEFEREGDWWGQAGVRLEGARPLYEHILLGRQLFGSNNDRLWAVCELGATLATPQGLRDLLEKTLRRL